MAYQRVHQFSSQKPRAPQSPRFAPHRFALPAQSIQEPSNEAYRPSYKLADVPIHRPRGLPDNLKTGIEALSGVAMDDVKVHHDSDQPARLDAWAYTRGTEIYLAPGQQQHLAHEAWHVVQQKQGRVRPTSQSPGIALNDQAGLEQEADVMGAKAAGTPTRDGRLTEAHAPRQEAGRWNLSGVIQRMRRHRLQREAARRQWGDISMSGRRRTRRTEIPLEIRALGFRLRQEYRRAQPGGPGERSGNYVYIATQRGRGIYIGITNNPQLRQVGHGERFHLHVLNPAEPLSRIETRGIEQFGINLSRHSRGNQNIAESIAAHHPYYDTAVRFGRLFYRWITAQYGPLLE